MRNATTDDLAYQMNQKTNKEIQNAINEGELIINQQRDDYISLLSVIDDSIVTFYKYTTGTHANIWFAKY